MKMKENSLSYSENDSAELELDPGIQNLIAPEMKGSAEVKFDGYGTLHVLERSEDGTLLHDSYFDKKDEEEPIITKKEYTSNDRLEHLMKQNMHLTRALRVEKILIAVSAVFFVLFCLLLYATLRRYM